MTIRWDIIVPLVGVPAFAFFLLSNVFKTTLLVYRNLYFDRTPGAPTDIPRINHKKLESETQLLTGLGFERLEDHLLYVRGGQGLRAVDEVAPLPAPSGEVARHQIPAGFTRVLVHPTHGCLAIVSAFTMDDPRGNNKTLPGILVSLTSLTGTEQDDWAYTTNNANFAPNVRATMKLVKYPRILSSPLPKAEPKQLLEFHLVRRSQVAEAAGLVWKTPLALQDQHAFEERLSANSRAAYSQMTPGALARRFYSTMWEKKDKEWLGELEGKLLPPR